MPVNLLDFNPNAANTVEEPKVTIASKIESDIMYNSTPDLPRLRYAGPQHLFLWDHTQEMDFWTKAKLNFPNDVRTDLFVGHTQHKLLPFRNIANFDGTYKAYLPLAPTWTNQMRPMDVGAFTSVTPKPIAGKVVSVSLKAMQFFDNYYCNGLVFDRIKMPITNSIRGTTMSCWMYVNKLTSIFKYDPHQQKYKASFDIDPQPFPTQEDQGIQGFKYSNVIELPSREVAV